MNKKNQKIRKRLEQERQTLEFAMRRIRLGGGGAAELSGAADEADIAVHTHDEGVASALQDSEAGRLKAINDALRRIDTDQWGFCANCEEPISPARIAAVPWATLCVHCQERLERVDQDESNTRSTKLLD